MRDIHGIDRILAILEPHWEEVEEEFERANRKFLELAETDHDPIGRVLRTHLIVENFLTTYLEQSLDVDDIGDARLTFAQKVALLPNSGDSAAFVKPGIKQLNGVRNKFGHSLDYQVRRADLRAVYAVLEVARQGEEFRDPIEAIEAFAPIACAFLSMPSEGLQDAFADAFRHVNIEPDRESRG
ncbi:hypothetical protein RZN05_19700 [Sphingomonas sp. HF-S4]|uniref:RiboL-PSP-HEPN domain-containing protein n=1 Tax=Sphingomonas agrestis TaxID=3080540 RepID=A0ABU3YCW0_9SPHN|nr:hypothetical protein [Sphingomonas sp. HF-S4]MDV3459231.1 hypothetical protein [Sphingomonas sp. HF-S4]